MRNKKLAFAAIAILSLLVIAGIALAQMGWGNRRAENADGTRQNGMMNGMMAHHGDMEELMEEGNYAGLTALREKLGFNIMPSIDNEQEFREMQELHGRMEKLNEGNGFGMKGCPMMG